MNTKAIMITASLVLGCAGLQAQTSVLPYTPGITQEGVTYYLPRTALSITVKATCTTRMPGDLHAYAGRYLKLNDVVKEKQVGWTIDEVSVTPYGVPDTSKVYSIALKKGSVAPLVSLTKSGLLLSVNARAEEEDTPKDPGLNKVEKSALNPRDHMTQEILMAGSAAKMAELTASEIYDLRDSRSQLSKGQADNMPKDGEQLKLMIQQLNTQEEALLQLFKGTEERVTRTFTMTYLPTKNVKKHILFRFSDELGVVDEENLAGEPVYIDVTNLKTVPTEQSDGKKRKTDEQALRYNVPSDAAIKLYTRERKLAELTTPMGQFGHVDILSSELFNKRATTQVFFHQMTGGVKNIVEESPAK